VLRAVKDEEEIDNLRQAAAIADKGFLHVLDIVKPGMTEKELALELEFFMRKQGASGLSFTTIVASGIRSSMPHGVASDKVIEKNDMLTLDFGCMYNGYCSDMTRTFVVGTADERQKELYNIVLETQLKVLEAIKPGARCKEIDALSREIIGGYGYGEFYGHGLGHGVGLEIHELPVLNGTSEFVLEENMVVTDEPGIYLPDFGGVRIEDTVLVTKDGYDLISRSTKEFIEIK
ncbi:M24 family metallopeptidase, partial [Filifactor alocis]|uniref:M24 family metallopeptidase n=1 Tax=Filifactor alocis TaxID=143361 RepID=UPI003F9FCA4D